MGGLSFIEHTSSDKIFLDFKNPLRDVSSEPLLNDAPKVREDGSALFQKKHDSRPAKPCAEPAQLVNDIRAGLQVGLTTGCHLIIWRENGNSVTTRQRIVLKLFDDSLCSDVWLLKEDNGVETQFGLYDVL